MKNMNKLPFAKVLFRITALTAVSAPLIFFLLIALEIIHAISHVINIYIMQYLFDTAESVVNARAPINKLLLFIGIIGLVVIFSNIIEAVNDLFAGIFYSKCAGKFTAKMNEKAGRLNLVEFDVTELYDGIEKAKEGLNSALSSLLSIVMGTGFHVVYFISVGMYLYTIKPALAGICALIFIPRLISQLIKASEFYRLEERTVQTKREFTYYERCLTEREYYKENRTLGVIGFFFNLYRKAVGIYCKEQWKTDVKTGLIDLGLSVITLFGYAGSFLLLAYYLINGAISIGAFAAVYYAIRRFLGVMSSLMELFGMSYRQASLASNLFRFLDMKERTGDNIDIDSGETITLQNVSFRYPGAKKNAVDNVTLAIEKGSTVAVVGVNGAGKTTLVKLIMGLYLSSNGSVFYGTENISHVLPKRVYEKTTAVFQKFVRYKMKLNENVSISDAENKSSKNTVEKNLNRAGFILDKGKLPDGLDTMISREFGGVDLSGGEWQKVAIARGFYRSHNLIVLDEPTAVIDPKEEARIYRKFIEASIGKTAIIVTHRLGAARIADRIIVMEKGKIIEDGTHEELLEQKGKYAQMFLSQAEWYER